MNLKGSNGIGGFWKFTDYCVSSGFDGAVNVNVAVYNTKKTQLRTYITFGYSHFANSESKAFNTGVSSGQATPPFPYGYPTARDTSCISNMRMNIPYLALGCELGVYLDPKNRSSLNFGLDYNFNVVTGRYYQTVTGSRETFTTLKGNLRNGLGLNASYSYKFSKVVGFHVGARFVLPNLFGKTSEMTNENAYSYLLDRANTTLNPNIISDRTIGYFKFFEGLSFFLGNM